MARRGGAAPPSHVRTRRGQPVAEPQRGRDHRSPRPPPRRPRPAAAGRASPALRARSDQEGAQLLQGEPPEGRPGGGARLRRRAPAPRRAHVRPRPLDGGRLPGLHPGGQGPGPDRAALQPHPGRGRGPLRPPEHHSVGPHGAERNPAGDAPPDAHLDHRRVEGAGRGLRQPPRHSRSRGSRLAGPRRRGLGASRRGGAPAQRAWRHQPGKPSADAGGAVPEALRGRARERTGARNGRGGVQSRRAGMNDLTGTGALVRLILRRDRIRISIWVVSITLLVFLTVVGVKSLFPTQASIDQAAAATQHNAGAIAFNGPAQGLDTLGGQIAFQVGALGMVVVALMSVFMIGRLTRGDEEAGRLELVRSLPVGNHAPTFAALIIVVAMNAAVGVLSSASLLAEGLPTAGSLVLGASFAAMGLFFTGAALVAAQITENTRVVYGSSGDLLGLAMRLQRGALMGWGAGVLVTGIAFGWIAPTIDSFVANNKAFAQMLASAGVGSLTDTYFATSFRIMALIASGFAIQSALRLRSEESALRAELVLATPVSRWRWAASHLTVAVAGSVGLVAVAGLATGVSYAIAGGPWSSVPRLLGAAVVYAPAMWLMIGLAAIVFGFAPRWVDVARGILAACFVIGLLGVVLRLPDWVQMLSPFERTPALPAASMAVLPLAVLTALAAVLILGGLGGLRQRDIG